MNLFFKSFILKGLLIIFMFNYAWAADTSYYVDAGGGSDSNTGLSHSQAWKTLSKVNNSTFNSGDNVYLLCGRIWKKQHINVDWSGTNKDRVIIGAYYLKNGVETVGVNGDGKPIIDGEKTYPASNHWALLRVENNYSHVAIQDIHVKNSHGVGILAARADYVIVQRCKVDWSYEHNISFFMSNYGEAYYNECSRGAQNRLDGLLWPPALGLRQSNYSTAMYNYVYNQYGEGIAVGDNGTVKYNLVVDTMSEGIYMDSRSNSEVAYNMVVGTSETTYTMPGSSWHAPGITIAIEPRQKHNAENNKVHHNIVINTHAGIRMRDAMEGYKIDNIYIYNNTLIDNRMNFHITTASELAESKVYIKNNISYPKHADSLHWHVAGGTINGWSVANNVWAVDSVSTKGSFPGTNYETGDPNFKKKIWRSGSFNMSSFSTSDLLIGAGSSAKDSGVDLGPDYSNLIAGGSNLHTTKADPNIGDPISITTVKQNADNPLWDIGATSTGASNGIVLPAPQNLRVLAMQ